jgi:cytochrome c biogenesis protein CcdA
VSVVLLATLAGLALVDSTSIGTIGVPIFLAAARTPARRVLLYLATITIFYFLVGAVLLLGLDSAFGALGDVLDSRGALAVQLVLGLILFVLAFRIDTGSGAARRSWRPRDSSPRAMVMLALTAGAIEVASMVPYIAAIALLTAADMPMLGRLGILAVYTAIMALPALVLLGVSSSGGPAFQRLLDRVGAWIQRASGEMLGWALGIAGFYLATSAFSSLFLA